MIDIAFKCFTIKVDWEPKKKIQKKKEKKPTSVIGDFLA